MKTVDIGYSNFVLASEIVAIIDAPFPEGETNLLDDATVPAFTFNNRCLVLLKNGERLVCHVKPITLRKRWEAALQEGE